MPPTPYDAPEWSPRLGSLSSDSHTEIDPGPPFPLNLGVLPTASGLLVHPSTEVTSGLPGHWLAGGGWCVPAGTELML